MKVFIVVIIFFLICKSCFPQQIYNDTICAESFCVNGVCINDKIEELFNNIGTPISKQKIIADLEEHSEPTRFIYWYGDMEFFEINNSVFKNRISGLKYEKGLLEESKINYPNIKFFIKSYQLESFTINDIAELFPNSYSNKEISSSSIFIKIILKQCEFSHQISDITFEFQNDTLIRFSTNLYLE